ncbi:MAG: D-glycero-beta-D-manno-heptose 1-phosphate adenylyltransferase, partial [Planctomycetia bacterium]
VDFDVVLVSDYDKGVCRPVLIRRLIEACRDHSLKILVDPIRGGDYQARYRGCSAMTPNRLEAGLAAGVVIHDLNDAFEAADKLRRELDMEVGVVTLDKEGIALVDAEGRRKHFPVRERQVYDITGAGDMVLAVMGMVLAAGGDYEQAIPLANTAGGLEVERIGVATLTRDEILQDLRHAPTGGAEKVVDANRLAGELDRLRRTGRRIVFTNGCFDVLHSGHVQYLREARAQGDVLVVGLNSDASVRALGKAPDRPVHDEAARATVLSGLSAVDYVVVFDDDTPLSLIESVRPDVLVKGADYKPEQVVGRAFVESYGGRLHLAALAPGLSTTAALRKLRGRPSDHLDDADDEPEASARRAA